MRSGIYMRGCLLQLRVYTSTAISSVESGIRPNSVIRISVSEAFTKTPHSNVRAVYVLLMYQCLVLHKLVIRVLIDG